MKPDTALFFLVKSLSQTEKTYFKRFSSRQSKSTSTLKLFDAIESTETKKGYDEERIKNEVKDFIPGDQFPVIKNYLYNNLLRALSGYHHKTNYSIAISSLVNNAEVLYQRGLLEQSLKILSKAKRKAVENESIIKLIEIINMERRSLRALAPLNNVSDELMKNYDEEAKFLSQIDNLNKYKRLFDEFVILLTEKGVSNRNEQISVFRKFMSIKLLSDISNANTVYARVLFNIIHLINSSIYGNPEDARSYANEVIKICLSNETRKIIYGYEYVLALQQMVTALRNLGHDKIAEKFVSEILSDLDNILRYYPQRVRNFLLGRTLINEAGRNINNGDFEKSRVMLEEQLDKMPADSYRDESIVTNYLASITFYALDEKEKALDHVNRILNSKQAEIRTDIQASARILNLILHYELGNNDSLKHFLRSVYHYLKKRDRLSQPEITILEFIRELVRAKNQDEEKIILLKAGRDISGIKADPNSQNTVNIFFIDIWLESKIKNNSFREIVKNRHLNS